MYVKIIARQDEETVLCLVRWVDHQTNEWLTLHVLASAPLREVGPIPKSGHHGPATDVALPKTVELRAIAAAERLSRRFEHASRPLELCLAGESEIAIHPLR
jgi:hypothetical protein